VQGQPAGGRPKGSSDEFTGRAQVDASLRPDRAASRQVAWDLGHSYVGVEHLFLATVQDPDAVPTQVLSRFVPPAQVGAAVRDLITSEGWGSQRSDPP
jgi:hypothetical protein